MKHGWIKVWQFVGFADLLVVVGWAGALLDHTSQPSSRVPPPVGQEGPWLPPPPSFCFFINVWCCGGNRVSFVNLFFLYWAWPGQKRWEVMVFGESNSNTQEISLKYNIKYNTLKNIYKYNKKINTLIF